MPFNFEASEDFNTSVAHINTLIQFAIEQREAENEDNRMLFLKLSVVSAVTKFQVFIESILKEYHYELKDNQKQYNQVSTHLRLNAIRLFTSDKIIHKALENPETYTIEKLNEIREVSEKTLAFCKDTETITDDLKFETKFPLGKTGVGELSKLFRQVNGEDIFANPPFDINKLNEILGRRHAIIHEDSNPQLTEETVEKYRDYLMTVITYVDDYLEQHL